jgi:hypothetical protein
MLSVSCDTGPAVCAKEAVRILRTSDRLVAKAWVVLVATDRAVRSDAVHRAYHSLKEGTATRAIISRHNGCASAVSAQPR